MAKNNKNKGLNQKALDKLRNEVAKEMKVTTVENKNNMEVVDMSELNKGMVVEQIEDLKNEVIEMHENMENCLESGLVDDAHEIHTEIVLAEDMIVDMEGRLAMFEENKIEEVIKERSEMVKMIDSSIRYAIIQGIKGYNELVRKHEIQLEQASKGIKIKKEDLVIVPKYVSAKELNSIVKLYKLRTNTDMCEKQIKCLRTLNPVQIQYITITLNKARHLAMA